MPSEEYWPDPPPIPIDQLSPATKNMRAGSECPGLERELNDFENDPITIHYGVGGELSPLIRKAHIKKCKACQITISRERRGIASYAIL